VVDFSGGHPTIGGSSPTAFLNVYVESNAVVALTNSSSVASGGTLSVTNGGRFDCATNLTGAGAFQLRPGGTVGIGSAAGIAASGATGSIQTTPALLIRAAFISTTAFPPRSPAPVCRPPSTR